MSRFFGFLLHPLRSLRYVYDWMLALAEKPGAEKALFGLSFAEASFFPLPPDPLLLAMGAGRPDRALHFALVTTVASVLGAMLGYAIGAFLHDTLGVWLLDLYDADRVVFDKITAWYEENGFLGILLAAITPIPFKVFTIASGILGYEFLPFLAASALGRSLRFFAEGLLLQFFGRPIANWMGRWFDVAAVGFAILLIGGFVLLKYL
ncbi:MAG TPA: VTT domain-containing protein [Planctomycetota bacterium]